MKFDGRCVHRDNDKWSRSAQDVMYANTILHLEQMKITSMRFEPALHYLVLGSVRRALVLRLHQEKKFKPKLTDKSTSHTEKIVL